MERHHRLFLLTLKRALQMIVDAIDDLLKTDRTTESETKTARQR
jgi:hypothetical protein